MAVRYWQVQDPSFLAQLRACLVTPDRQHKVLLFECLVSEAPAPVGELWSPGTTAVYLRDSSRQRKQVGNAPVFWTDLLSV